MSKPSFIILVAIFCFGFVASSVAATLDPLQEIAELREGAQKSLKAKKTTVRHFKHLFSQNGKNSEVWHVWDGKPHPNESAGEWASIYQNEQGWFFLIRLQSTSPSGDWGCHADYYFRRDQSIALIESEYRTFSSGIGSISVQRKDAFSKGRKIDEQELIVALKDPHKPLPKDTPYLKAVCPDMVDNIAGFPFME